MTIRLNAADGKRIASYLLLTLLLFSPRLHAECEINLSWDANSTTPDGYRVYQRESGENYNYNTFKDAGQSSSCPISGLSDNTTYHFVVRAYIGADESGDSNEATFTCGESNPPPAAMPSTPPIQPLAVSPSNQTLDVGLQPTLTASAFIDHDAGDYHANTRWMIYRLDDDACVLDTTSSSALTSLTVPSSTLSPFTSYYWKVCYYDQGGIVSAPSQACDFTTLQVSANDPTEEPINEPTNVPPNDDPPASLSSSDSGGSSGSSGSGLGCFIQTFLGDR